MDFTGAAAAKVRELIAEEGNAALKLRVYIQGGGCSGFTYVLGFDEKDENDNEYELDGIFFIMNPKYWGFNFLYNTAY